METRILLEKYKMGKIFFYVIFFLYMYIQKMVNQNKVYHIEVLLIRLIWRIKKNKILQKLSTF